MNKRIKNIDKGGSSTSPCLPSIFISYSHQDSEYKESLVKHLRGLERQHIIRTWHDGLISPGQEWRDEIISALSSAEVAILLVSSDFIASDFCYSVEMTKLLNRHEAKTCIVIPVIVRECSWGLQPFSKLKVLPQNGRAISTNYQGKEDVAYTEVCDAIVAVLSAQKPQPTEKSESIEDSVQPNNQITDGSSKPIAICPGCYLRLYQSDLVRFGKRLVSLNRLEAGSRLGCPDCGALLVPLADRLAICAERCGFAEPISETNHTAQCPHCRARLQYFNQDGTEMKIVVEGSDARDVLDVLQNFNKHRSER